MMKKSTMKSRRTVIRRRPSGIASSIVSIARRRTVIAAAVAAAVVCYLSSCVVDAFSSFLQPPAAIYRAKTSRTAPLNASTSSADEERRKLLEKASQLREEVARLEQDAVKSERRRQRTTVEQKEVVIPAQYKELEGSYWKMTYRFADQPEPDDGKDPVERTFYSGTLTLHFREDGFTDIIDSTTKGSTSANIIKAWGWDKEVNEDKEYLLFSIEVELPATADSSSDDKKQQKVYFQTRVDKNGRTGLLSLKEGTVTMKQDVRDSKTAGMWGLSPRGILAQFRYVGDFVSQPVQTPQQQ